MLFSLTNLIVPLIAALALLDMLGSSKSASEPSNTLLGGLTGTKHKCHLVQTCFKLFFNGKHAHFRFDFSAEHAVDNVSAGRK